MWIHVIWAILRGIGWRWARKKSKSHARLPWEWCVTINTGLEQPVQPVITEVYSIRLVLKLNKVVWPPIKFLYFTSYLTCIEWMNSTFTRPQPKLSCVQCNAAGIWHPSPWVQTAPGVTSSDVKRGQNLEAEAKALRPRPELWGRGRGQK